MIGGKKNKVAGSWNQFVMKIKKEEGIASLKEAMKRASKRKSEWKRGGDGEVVEEAVMAEETPMEEEMVEETVAEEMPMEVAMEEEVMEQPSDEMAGGKKRNVSQFAFGGARRSRASRRARSSRKARASRRGRSVGVAGGARRSRRRSASLARAQKRSRASRRAMGLALARR
jgi:hypothetical protein